ncbi:MAG: hypothetical protein K8963_09295, partial [Proteobacteria bacterium]|nr:hypothetical protein [Pseudomonadota bacterium]
GSQTVNLDFNLAVTATIPATLNIANAGDTVVLDINTTAAGGINLANAIDLSPATDSTLVLTGAVGAIVGSGALSADTMTVFGGGDLTATGILTADSLTLSAAGIGSSTTARVNVAVSDTLTLTTLAANAGGNIYLAANVLPSVSLSALTATATPQIVDLDFNLVTAPATLGALTIARAGDTVVLDINSTTTGPTGNIVLTNPIDLSVAASSTVNLDVAADISGAGAISASTISLEADGNITLTGMLSAPTLTLDATAIGSGTGGRVNLNAPNSLTLMSSGATTAGGIYINASSFPSTSLSVTTVATGNQVPVVDLIFTQATGNIALPSLTLGMGSSVAITATGGNITGGTNVLMADAISLSAVGIGTEASVVRLDPENTLSLTSTGVANAGNIYFSLLSNTATLTLAANPASVQTVSLLQNLSSDLTLSAFPTFTLTGLNNIAGPADLLNIGYIVTGNISISGVITTPDGASISLTATGAITDTGGTASIDATTVTLSAARIGISTNPLTVNATTDLTATATGNTNGDYIYIDGQTMPSTTLTASAAGSGQAVQFSFNTGVGDASLPTTISFQDNDNTSFTLSADGNISGTVAADTITLDATNGDVAAATDGNIINATLTGGNITLTALSIGTSGTRVAASATDSLSLTTTGSSSNGNIYISGSTVPTTLLSATTHASEQTVDFDYVVASGNIALPTTSTFDVAGDIVNFTLSAGTTAASNISGNLDADTISLTTMSGNITASTLNA